MPISLKTQAERTAKTPIQARRARVGGLCDFQDTVERVPAGSPKTGRCAAVRERWQKTSEQDEMAAGKPLAANAGTRRNGQNREILDAAARKQDKRMASKPTLFLVTTARSADCIKGLRRRCDWRLFGEKYARLASEIPQMQTVQGIPARHAADWRIMSKEENRLNFRMSPETAEKLEHWFKLDGCRSKNEFLERAVNYYADHLAVGTSTMLPRAVQSAIDGRLQLLEQRLSSLLFKQAVELDMGLSLLAECVNLDESVLRKQRAKSVNDVKRTNGQLRLEQKVRAQEPFDEWPD